MNALEIEINDWAKEFPYKVNKDGNIVTKQGVLVFFEIPEGFPLDFSKFLVAACNAEAIKRGFLKKK